jgi:uncharacterized membrane protein
MMRSLVAYIGAAVVFAALDAVWLTATNASVYRPALGPVLADAVRPVPAVLFYAVYLAGRRRPGLAHRPLAHRGPAWRGVRLRRLRHL